MSILSSALIFSAINRKLSDSVFNSHGKRFVKSYFKDNEVAFFDDAQDLIVHSTISLDGTELKSYEHKINDTNLYIIYVYGFDQKYDFYKEISNTFELNGYNSIFIENRKKVTLGSKEAIDLLVWIDYFSNQKPDKKFILFGEKTGANIISKALESDINDNVINVILDDVKATYFNDLINEYCLNNYIENTLKMAKNINLELNKRYMINIDEFNLKNSLKTNKIPVCFVQSKLLNQYEHNELLKLFNSNNSSKKIFYTKTLSRNYEQENYFEVLLEYLKNL
ncbi:MAG: hypothetical protein Q4F12_04980 [Erysipelotrichaceae bacterium]|nr:hypothetical protein [Erysipelotrichaceae bacterium]